MQNKVIHTHIGQYNRNNWDLRIILTSEDSYSDFSGQFSDKIWQFPSFYLGIVDISFKEGWKISQRLYKV